MRKSMAVLAAVVLLFTACGKEGEQVESLGGTASATPAASAGADSTKTAKPSATSGATQTSAPAASASSGGGGTKAPAKTAVPGKTQPPADGMYTYDYKGKATDPTNPAAGPQDFSGESYTEVSHSGEVYTFEGTDSESAGRSTTKSKWTSTQVSLLEIIIETPIGTFQCKFDPPLIVTRFPVKPGKYPTQNFKGEGNACNGKLDITIEAQETIKDANAKSWSTWRAKVRTEVTSGGFHVVMNETRWASPDLGIEVKSVSTQNGEVTSGTFKTKFSGSGTKLLKKQP